MADEDVENIEDVAQENERVPASGSILDSRTSYLDDALKEKLDLAFHQPTSQVVVHELIKIASEHDAIDLAYAVTRLPMSARPLVFENLPDTEAKTRFLVTCSNTTRSAVLRNIDNEQVRKLVDKMPPDEAVEVIDDLPKRRRRKVLEMLDAEKAFRIRELQRHEVHTAGRLMTNEFFAFSIDTTIREVAQAIRNNPGIDLTRWIFVVDDDDELVGYVPSRNLIVNQSDWPLKRVMRPIPQTVTPEASRDEVVDIVERYKIPALPVIDKNNRVVGVVAYDDVVEIIEDIADETIASIAGTAEDVSEHDPMLLRFLLRAPWLVVTLCAGLATATLLAHFHERTWFAVLPFFVPLITGMSGNVGIQTSTLLVRGMSTGELSRGAQKDAVFKELSIGLLTGTIFGVTCGVVVYILNTLGIYEFGYEPYAVGILVSCGVLGACVTSASLGSTSPLLFARLGIDPAIAAGPIVTACNDVLSTMIFILIAWGLDSLIFYA